VLVAPRRRVLDAIVADAAVEAGAELHTGTAVTGLCRHGGGRVVGLTARTASGREVAVPARHVVGADGLRSTVAGLDRAPAPTPIGSSPGEVRPAARWAPSP
jgi:flavin-dependent dehydrogenase